MHIALHEAQNTKRKLKIQGQVIINMDKNNKNKSKEQQKKQRIENITSSVEVKPSKTDPFGSYTGVPFDKNEEPIQDADDL